MNNKFIITITIICTFAFSTANSYGDPVPLPAKTLDPGVIDKARQMDLNPIYKFNDSEQNEDATNNVEEININEVKEEKSAVKFNPKFKINKLIFTGNTIFSSNDLEALGQNFIGKEITISQLIDFTEKITNYYHNYGYITSSAYLPPQKIENGKVEIAVMEGKVGNINVEGLKWTKLSYVKKKFLKENDVKEDQIFNINNFKKSMEELEETNYLKGKAVIERGSKPKTSDIVIKIKEDLPIECSVNWDNLGRDVVGIQRATINLADNNLTGFGDKLYTSTSLASRMFGLGTGYSIPLGPYGTELHTDYSYSNISLGGEYRNLAIKGYTHSLSTTLSQPLYKDNSFSLNSRIMFEGRHSKIIQQGYDLLNNYEDRAIRVGLNATKDDRFGRWIADTEVSTGIPILGASVDSCRGQESSKFIKFNSSLYRIQALPLKSSGILRVSTQFTPNTLLPSEQMQLGGMYTVRGFDEGLLLGDAGYNLSLETRTPVPYLPNSINIPYWKDKSYNLLLKNRIYFVLFYDQGFVHKIHKSEEVSYMNFLQSCGTGLSVYLTKSMTANMDLGIPLGKERTIGQNLVRFHFGLSAGLL